MECAFWANVLAVSHVNELNETMSNSLSNLPPALVQLAQGASATAPAAQTLHLPAPSVWIIAIGICTLLVWIVSAVANPAKLTLAKTPRRPNSINPAHIAVPLLLVIMVTLGMSRILERLFEAGSLRLNILVTLSAQAVWAPAGLAVAAFTFHHGLRRGLGLSLRRWKYDTVASVIACLCALPICFALALLVSSIIPPHLQKPHMMLTAARQLSGVWVVMVALSVLVLAPICEEVFFRGLLQSMLRKYLGGPRRAILVTSLLFALMHHDQPQHIPALFALGVVLGYNYERHGRVYTPIMIHALFNAVNPSGCLIR